jgi:hypothetical protein
MAAQLLTGFLGGEVQTEEFKDRLRATNNRSTVQIASHAACCRPRIVGWPVEHLRRTPPCVRHPETGEFHASVFETIASLSML